MRAPSVLPVPAAPVRRTQPLLALLCTVALGACGGAATPPGDAPAPEERVLRLGNGFVFPSEHFEGRPNLLHVLSARISNMRVSRQGVCPDVVFRGQSSLQQSSSARVYVNGQEAVNTCVLEMVSTWDVERVEVYPSGIVRRPGYPVSGTGSILVFTKAAGDGQVATTN